jgi:hypothetical protein
MGFALVFRRYAPFARFGFGFDGDHRQSPSVSMQATARTTGVVPFARGSIDSLHANSSGTQFTGGGDWLRKLLGRHVSNVTCKLSNKLVSTSSVSFTASTAGANPMVPGAPDIDTFVDFRAVWSGTGVRFFGVVRGDDFPNAEVFVLDSKGQGFLLFDGRTTGGQNTGPMTRLAGAHASQTLGTFQCAVPLSPQGIFLSARNSCPVTKMEPGKPPSQARLGRGGQFARGGATGRW